MLPTSILIIFVIILIWICSGLCKVNDKKKNGSQGRPTRIDHPHYFEDDDHECSVCGARFRGKSMTCPKCGTKFTGTREDDGEFVEEMVIWDDEDDD